MRYLVEVFWSDEDDGYIAVVPDLPGCSPYGRTPEEAVHEIRRCRRSLDRCLPRRRRSGAGAGRQGASGGVSILTASVPPASRIKLVWADAPKRCSISLPSWRRGGVFAFLTNPAAFNAVAVGPCGCTLVWQDLHGD